LHAIYHTCHTFSLYTAPGDHPHLHSFPTRRSSDLIPFPNPIAGVRVGLVNGRYVINPTYDEVRESRINLIVAGTEEAIVMVEAGDRKSTRLNSSHLGISYAVFCLKKKK